MQENNKRSKKSSTRDFTSSGPRAPSDIWNISSYIKKSEYLNVVTVYSIILTFWIFFCSIWHIYSGILSRVRAHAASGAYERVGK